MEGIGENEMNKTFIEICKHIDEITKDYNKKYSDKEYIRVKEKLDKYFAKHKKYQI